MANESKKGPTRKLCRPCIETLKKQGKVQSFHSLGIDVKITCEQCNRRRYGHECVMKG